MTAGIGAGADVCVQERGELLLPDHPGVPSFLLRLRQPF